MNLTAPYPVTKINQVLNFFAITMLTHSSRHNNISLNEEHFKNKDSSGKNVEIQYEKSFIAGDLLYKKQEWAPFTKHGEITAEGLAFINKHIRHLIPKFSPLNK